MSRQTALVKGIQTGHFVLDVTRELEPGLRQHVLLRVADVADGLEVRCPFDSEAREFFKAILDVIETAQREAVRV